MQAAGFHVVRERDVVWVSGGVRDNRPHKHHALQVTWGAPDTVAQLELEDVTLAGACVVVNGGVTHALELQHGLICLLDSASERAKRVRAQFIGDAGAAVIEGSAWSGSFDQADSLLGNLARPTAAKPVDERVRDVLDWLDALESASRWTTVSLDGALRRIHLSASRFLHLFSQEVGSPWRTYLVWRRALVAITLVSGGANLTEAAHAAGYTDSAHLSRQFVSLFGITPAAFTKNSHFVQS